MAEDDKTRADELLEQARGQKADDKAEKPEGDKPAELDERTAEAGRIRQGGQDRRAQAKTDRVNRAEGQMDVDELHRTEEQKRQTSQAASDKLSSTDFTVGGEDESFNYAGMSQDHIAGQHQERLDRLHEERFSF